jgi:hypothetical protein
MAVGKRPGPDASMCVFCRGNPRDRPVTSDVVKSGEERWANKTWNERAEGIIVDPAISFCWDAHDPPARPEDPCGPGAKLPHPEEAERAEPKSRTRASPLGPEPASGPRLAHP